MTKIVRTDSENKDFTFLVKQLDAYLKVTDGNEHDFYNQFNSIDTLKYVVVAYADNLPVGCGAFKRYNKNTVEVKRMFTKSDARGRGIATLILNEFEDWATELNYSSLVLETGISQKEAVQFYKKSLYKIIPNYEPYTSMKNSLCFEKELI